MSHRSRVILHQPDLFTAIELSIILSAVKTTETDTGSDTKFDQESYLKLQYREYQDLVFIDKPTGFLCQGRASNNENKTEIGLLEILESELSLKLYPCLQLDKTTTGVLCFAKSADAAKEIEQLFEQTLIEKTYWFVTDSVSQDEEIQAGSQNANLNVNLNKKAKQNISTNFKRIKRTPFFELWAATTTSDNDQQIRQHAAQVGLAILGDTTHGGSAFPHLCLHVLEIKIPDVPIQSSPPPRFFERMGLLKDLRLVQYLSELDRRQRLYNFLQLPEQCLRLIDTENERCDMFGKQLWIYWYHEHAPSAKDLIRWNFVAQLISKEWHLHWMKNRGQNPHEKSFWQSENWKTNWIGLEGETQYQLSSEKGQSPGLFLDQAKNREKTLQICQQNIKTEVLNLFSYTCGFSLQAALSQTAQVTTVDASSPFLEWGKQNFKLNKIDPNQHQFFSQDVMLFLKGALKRQRLFDLIICDPPSFGRSKEHVFKLDKDYQELLTMCWQILRPGGKILFSTNYENWNESQWLVKIQKVLPSSQFILGPDQSRQPPRNSPMGHILPRWDYELPKSERKLKSFWLQKK